MKKSDFTTEMIDGEVVYWKNKDNKGNPICKYHTTSTIISNTNQ